MAKFRFLLKAGKHEDKGTSKGRGKVYKTGEIIETDLELDELFGKNKFKRLKAVAAAVEEVDEDDDEEAEAPKPKKKAKAKPKKPDPVEEDEDDDEEEADKAKDEQTESERLTAIESSLGENVTSDFDDAIDAGLIVLKEGREYRVAEADEPDTALVSEVPLTSKDKVHEFIKTQTA